MKFLKHINESEDEKDEIFDLIEDCFLEFIDKEDCVIEKQVNYWEIFISKKTKLQIGMDRNDGIDKFSNKIININNSLKRLYMMNYDIIITFESTGNGAWNSIESKYDFKIRVSMTKDNIDYYQDNDDEADLYDDDEDGDFFHDEDDEYYEED